VVAASSNLYHLRLEKRHARYIYYIYIYIYICMNIYILLCIYIYTYLHTDTPDCPTQPSYRHTYASVCPDETTCYYENASIRSQTPYKPLTRPTSPSSQHPARSHRPCPQNRLFSRPRHRHSACCATTTRTNKTVTHRSRGRHRGP
jgi:hypothetical protein